MTTFADLHHALDEVLDAREFQGLNDPNGVWRAATGEIGAVGFLLEPWNGIDKWVQKERFDALVIHRPWDLPQDLFGDPGVLAYHLAFDERLTIGFNPLLAAQLEITDLETLGSKQGRPVGMIGNVPATDVVRFTSLLARSIGGLPEIVSQDARGVGRVAIVGAMWPELINEAAQRGADIYVTGTLRTRALPAVESTGIPVVLVGHRPPEVWGLNTLAREISALCPRLKIKVAPTAALNLDVNPKK